LLGRRPVRRQLSYATVAILKAARQGSRYGLDIMDATGLPSGTVYPTLARLESRGLVSGRWERPETAEREGRPRRRYYALTASGEQALDEALVQFGTLAASVAGERGRS